MEISKYLKKQAKSAVNNIKSFVVNKGDSALSQLHPSNLISIWGGPSVTRDGIEPNAEVNALLKKSPFEKVPGSHRDIEKKDPLGFYHIQYPPELTGEEMGNWILFLAITNNVGDNPAFGSDFELAEELHSAGHSTGRHHGNLGERNSPEYDAIREQYKQRGIDLKKIRMQNTVARLAQDKKLIGIGEGGAGASLDLVSGAIALYMPPDIKVSYGAEWGTEDTNIAGDISAAMKELANTEEEGKDLVHSMLKHGWGTIVKGAKELIGSTAAGAGIGDWFKIAGKNLGFAINNHREMFYEGPDFRTFSYQFMFWPRNKDETERAQKVITMFKYHMHPWKRTEWGSRFFQYPSEFEIHYLAGTGVNKHLNKISRCALTKCDVSYGPEGGNFKTFEDHAPVTYKLDLQFKELEYMTKQTMKGGF